MFGNPTFLYPNTEKIRHIITGKHVRNITWKQERCYGDGYIVVKEYLDGVYTAIDQYVSCTDPCLYQDRTGYESFLVEEFAALAAHYYLKHMVLNTQYTSHKF